MSQINLPPSEHKPEKMLMIPFVVRRARRSDPGIGVVVYLGCRCRIMCLIGL